MLNAPACSGRERDEKIGRGASFLPSEFALHVTTCFVFFRKPNLETTTQVQQHRTFVDWTGIEILVTFSSALTPEYLPFTRLPSTCHQ